MHALDRSRLLLMEKSSASRPIAFTAACTSLTKGPPTAGSIGIDEDSKPIGARYKLVQEPESLCRKLFGHAGDAGDVRAGPVEAAHKTGRRSLPGEFTPTRTIALSRRGTKTKSMQA